MLAVEAAATVAGPAAGLASVPVAGWAEAGTAWQRKMLQPVTELLTELWLRSASGSPPSVPRS